MVFRSFVFVHFRPFLWWIPSSLRNGMMGVLKMVLTWRRRKRYLKTLERCWFTDAESRICMILYDRLGIEFMDDIDGYLYIGKRNEDGNYLGKCFACRGLFYGKSKIVFTNSLWQYEKVFSFRELSRRYPHLGIPEFKTERELRMKLELMGISP